jgi:hypothetical protein
VVSLSARISRSAAQDSIAALRLMAAATNYHGLQPWLYSIAADAAEKASRNFSPMEKEKLVF